MTENISIDKEKSRLLALVNASAVLLFVYLVFWGLSGVCFGILELSCRLDIIGHVKEFHCEWGRFFYQPWYVLELYENWWNMLLESFRLMNIRPILFVPCIVPFIMLIVIIMAFVKTNYSFRLWYVLNHHFARLKDVTKMGLTKELFMVLSAAHLNPIPPGLFAEAGLYPRFWKEFLYTKTSFSVAFSSAEVPFRAL